MQQSKADLQKISKIIENCYHKNSQMSCESWDHVLSNRDWDCLKSLCLINCDINHNNIKAITNKKWTNLQEIDLINNKLDNDKIVELMNCEWPKLVTLVLCQNNFNDDMLKIYTEKLIMKIKQPSFGKNLITPNGLRAFLGFNLDHLSYLDLHQNKISHLGAKIISKLQCPNITKLWLSKCQLGNEGIKHLSKSKFPHLSLLSIQDNFSGLQGETFFAQHQNMKLQLIRIGNTDEIDEGFQIIDGVRFMKLAIMNPQKRNMALTRIQNDDLIISINQD